MPRGVSSELPNKGRRGGGFIRHIRLRHDGEFSRFRFLTDGGDIYIDEFHTIHDPGGSGPRWYEKICEKAAFGTPCELCEKAGGDNSDVSYPRTQVLAWTYEMQHFYHEKPEKVQAKRAKVNGVKMYVEEVGEPRLLRISVMHRGAIKTRFERHGTLLDRPFDWIRDGERGSKRPNYTLEPLDKEKMPKELRELMETLPDLEDIALGKVERLDSKREDDEDEEEGYGTRKVSVKDDGDDDGDDEDDVVNEFAEQTVDDSEDEDADDEKESKKVEEDDEDDGDDEDPFS